MLHDTTYFTVSISLTIEAVYCAKDELVVSDGAVLATHSNEAGI
jgi:hypothetical protein